MFENKEKGEKITIWNLPFADAAAFVAHSAKDLQTLLFQLSSTFSDKKHLSKEQMFHQSLRLMISELKMWKVYILTLMYQ